MIILSKSVLKKFLQFTVNLYGFLRFLGEASV